jgi:hypothetical protein
MILGGLIGFIAGIVIVLVIIAKCTGKGRPLF